MVTKNKNNPGEMQMKKILIVEDEETISNLVKMNLNAEGYRCTSAIDGKEAADFIPAFYL